MTQDKVHEKLNRHQGNPVMLDAFWQWANSWLRRVGEGKHAWAQEKSYRYFLESLRLRYGLNQTQAEAVGMSLEQECNSLVEGTDLSEVKRAIIEALQGALGESLRREVQRRFDGASLTARCLLASYHWLGTLPNYQYSIRSSAWGSPLDAVLRATLGTLPGSEVKPFQQARDELIACGVFNRSFYEIGTGKTSYDEYIPGPLVPHLSLEDVVAPPGKEPIAAVVDSLFDNRMFESARTIEEVARQGGVADYYTSFPRSELSEDVLPVRGLFAYVDAAQGKTAAVNPLARDQILEHIVDVKARRLAGAAKTLRDALFSIRDEIWPRGEVTHLKDDPDRKVWRFDQLEQPRLFVFLGNWTSGSDLALMRELGADPYRDSFLFVLYDQSVPAFRRVVGESLKMWERSSIAVTTPHGTAWQVYPVQRDPHVTVAEIVSRLGGGRVPLTPLAVTLTLAPKEVAVGEEVTAEVDVRDPKGQPVAGVGVKIRWNGIQAEATSGDQGTCVARHRYETAGIYNVTAEASKTGFASGKAEHQISVSTRGGGEPLTHSITFPPYAEGTSLVFGRGVLKDRIALGFEAGKQVSAESLVTWQIHSVDQPFICTFQQIGMGKSTLANCIMLQAAFQGIPVVVFDPKPDYLASLVPVYKTIQKFPDYADPISDRFREAGQDMRGFDLSRPLEFEYEGKTLRLRYQVFSFSPEIQKLGGRPLKMPLVVLPPSSDPMFREICDSIATSVATALHKQWQQQAYNTTLSALFRRFRQEHPTKDYLLPSDLERELEKEADAASDKAEKRRLGNLVRALQGYCTAQSWLYAATEDEVAKPNELVQNPGYAGGDGETVTITVLDLSRLPQDKRNPARMNYVSNVCGYLYNLVGRRRSSRPAQFLLVMDEAANYLPDPTDQFNQTLTIIRQGRSLGIRVWLIAQAPGQVEIQARNQAFRMVLSQIPAHAIRPELTRWQPDEAWTQKLAQTDKGRALVMDKTAAAQGGILTQLFTSPQTIDLLNADQILELLSPVR